MILKDTLTLANGVSIPKMGLGTWMMTDDAAAQAVKDAVSLGYRHIDTAQAYGNEAGVGRGVKKCGVPRKELFVTSKVAAEHKSYDLAAASIDESLKKSGLDYFDMMIIHSPQPWAEFRGENRYFAENKEAWRALEDAYKAGKLRAIGVSNFLIDDLESLLADCSIKPMVNQILAHIGNTPFALMDFCRKENIAVEAYSPIAHGEALNKEAIAAMAKKYNASTAQLCLAYVLQQDMIALPKTENKDHMAQNCEIDFTITAEDMEALKEMRFEDNYGEYSYFPVFSGK